MKLREINFTAGEIVQQIAGLLRDLIAILNGGIRESEQMFGGMISAQFISTVPTYLESPSKTPPLGLRLIRAKEPTSGDMKSGNHVSWTWTTTGQIRIDAIDGLTAATTYDLLLRLEV
jgi:hypothetical protein